MTHHESFPDPEFLLGNLHIQRLYPSNSLDAQMVNNDLMIFMQQQGLQTLYPEFNSWFNDKVIPGFFTGERLIHVATDSNTIYGTSIVKLSDTETKLCNLVVAPPMRKRGIGTKLLQQTIDTTRQAVLNENYSSKIIATVPEDFTQTSEENNTSTLHFLEKFGFEITEVLPNQYRNGIKEYVLTATLN